MLFKKKIIIIIGSPCNIGGRIKWFKKTSCTELHTRKSTALQSDQKVNPSSTT